VVSPKAKLTRPVRKPKATWVELKFYADVEFRDITSEGLPSWPRIRAAKLAAH
jgi:bifunctional non-homologous end joining protein LigD